MSSAFKNSGWLEGLNDTVMTDDIVDYFAKGYVENMITDKDGNIIGVLDIPVICFLGNQQIMDEVGITSIDTKEDFMKYMGQYRGTADTDTAVPGENLCV